jgi:hypothetical protein
MYAALTNPKHEKFCTGIVLEGMNITDSYAAAGFKRNRQNAHKLRQHPDIVRRCSELIEQQTDISRKAVVQAIEKKQISVESILDSIQRALDGAEKDQDWRTVVQAAMAQARVTGNIAPEKHLVKNVGPSISDLSDDELQMRLEALSGSVRAEQEELCERLGLDPSTLTLAELWALEDEDKGIDRSDQALDVTPDEEPLGTRHMPPLGAQGVRVPNFKREPQEPKMLTRGEAQLQRRGVNAPRIINGTASK